MCATGGDSDDSNQLRPLSGGHTSLIELYSLGFQQVQTGLTEFDHHQVRSNPQVPSNLCAALLAADHQANGFTLNSAVYSCLLAVMSVSIVDQTELLLHNTVARSVTSTVWRRWKRASVPRRVVLIKKMGMWRCFYIPCNTDSERFRKSYGIFPSGTSTTQYGFWELEEHPASFWMLRKWTESV